MKKLVLALVLTVAAFVGYDYYLSNTTANVAASVQQLNDGGSVLDSKEASYINSNLGLLLGVGIVGFWLVLFKGELKDMGNTIAKAFFPLLFLFMFVGCKPYEPQKLEQIGTNEEAFLIPFVGDTKAQSSTSNEEYLRSNLVFSKQVRIPQQWIKTSYGVGWASGEWRDAASLIKVDKAPVTREWTADPNSGTSNKNEAIWVMTSDQVEFSTGWTCTARIPSRDDAVKFLHNYPNGSLSTVMDGELRARIQTEFGLEVTDLPMEKLRKDATPHIKKVIESTTKFFEKRGVQITNLGISGGFVYKDKSVMDTLVKVFNAEQEKNVAMAEAQAQAERNKKVQLEAESRAKATLTERTAEAEGIKAVAEAKFYEIEKAKEDMALYIQLKNLEMTKIKLEKWDGRFPTYFMGDKNPDMLLQMPKE